MIYFISGHRDLTKEEFEKYYIPKINKALSDDKNPKFIMGDYQGADIMAQKYLFSLSCHNIMTVYHMFDKPRNLASEYIKTKGGYKDDIDRDSAMTRDSDFDIAFIREGKVNSGTEQNIMRRIKFS